MHERIRRDAEKDCVPAIHASLKFKSGILDATTAWGDNDTSSRPPKDLGGTLRRTAKPALWSYDSRASGDQECPLRQGCVANLANTKS